MPAPGHAISERAEELARWLEVRGMLALVFGVMFLERAGTGVGMLVAIFAVYCFFDAISAFSEAITRAAMRSHAVVAVEGALSLAAGILAATEPRNAAVVILIVIAARAILVGALELIAAVRLRRSIGGAWPIVLPAVLSILFGALLLKDPREGLFVLARLVGIYGVVVGIAQLVAGMAIHHRLKGAPPLRPTGVRT